MYLKEEAIEGLGIGGFGPCRIEQAERLHPFSQRTVALVRLVKGENR
jgi:hypothetical protein